MTRPPSTSVVKAPTAGSSLQGVVQDVTQYFVNRDEVARVTAVAILAHEHVLLHGPKGCAKTDVAKEIFKRIVNAKHFAVQGTEEMPYTDFTGPVMFSKLLNQDIEEFNITGYAYDAHYLLLDEYGRFAGGSLNKLLGLLNKDLVKNGNQLLDVILHTAIGTSNTRLTGSHEANADRFLFQMHLKYLESDADLAALDEIDIRLPVRRVGATVDLADIDAMHNRVPIVKANTDPEIWAKKREIVKRLRAEGVTISDRRYKKANQAVAAHALYEGRDRCTVDDLAILLYVFGESDEHAITVRKAVTEIANPVRLQVVSKLDEAVVLHRDLFEKIEKATDQAEKQLVMQTAISVLEKIGVIVDELEDITKRDLNNAAAAKALDQAERLQQDVRQRGVFLKKLK